MKKNHVIWAMMLVLAMTMTSMPALGTSYLPMFRQQEVETVTITREEYERLLQFEKLDYLMALVEAYYYEDVDTEEMLESAAIGLLAGVNDVYTFYYTKEDVKEFNEEAEGEYAGIGCQLLADPTDYLITVTRVFKGSPAEKAGIRAGDKIVYVNDVYYSATEMTDAVDVMRGEPGGTVKVTVMRGLETIDFDVVREIVNINYVEYQILDNNIGYVMVYDFLGDAYEGFAEAIDTFKAAGVSGVIIDLRNNGGGLVDACVKMADLILPKGVVVSMKEKSGYTREYKIDDEYTEFPLVVLVNEYSASASEILAGAIRDNHAGTLVGTKSFGKGVVQSMIEFPDGTGVQITTARYYTPSGECIHEVGIEPDIEVELDEEVVTLYGINNLPHEEDAQLQKAIEVLMNRSAGESAESAATGSQTGARLLERLKQTGSGE